jgi:hypothetical protein
MWRSGNASPCHGEVPGPIPGIRSQGALGQLLLMARDQLVVGGSPQSCQQRGSIPRRASMESEPARGRASLLTSAHRKVWASTAPLSADRLGPPGRWGLPDKQVVRGSTPRGRTGR